MVLSILGKLNSLQEAEEYNRKEVDAPVLYRGCINSRACINCFSIVQDSICLCSGFFECPRCGHINGKELFKSISLIEQELT